MRPTSGTKLEKSHFAEASVGTVRLYSSRMVGPTAPLPLLAGVMRPAPDHAICAKRAPKWFATRGPKAKTESSACSRALSQAVALAQELAQPGADTRSRNSSFVKIHCISKE